MRWDPARYAQYASERSRPFYDLTAQIAATDPSVVVDLGCGSGELTVSLAQRWPDAQVRGIDNSPEMIAAAPDGSGVDFSVADAGRFSAAGVDVLVSNAMLQWLPGNDELLSRWAGELNSGGWLAFQVPANFDSPSHTLMRELAGSGRWRAKLSDVLRHDAVLAPERYLELLTVAGLRTNVWQTSYLHVLGGDDPVLDWVRGTGLRPILAALPDVEAAEFTAEYRDLLRRAYPRREYGTVFPFLRTFVVAAK